MKLFHGLILVSTVLVSGCANPNINDSRIKISETSNRITMSGTDQIDDVSQEGDSLVVKGQIVTFSHGRSPIVSSYSFEHGIFSVTLETKKGEGPTSASENEASIYRMEIRNASNISRLIVHHNANMEKTVFNKTIQN